MDRPDEMNVANDTTNRSTWLAQLPRDEVSSCVD
jgi:hypothetical protein